MIKEATRETAEKIIELLSYGLCSGLGKPVPGQMCVEELVCYALGLPHSDEPICVSSAVRVFKIRLNDSSWSINQARAEGMKRLAIAQLNSAGAINNKEFAKRVSEMAIRKIVPFALREAARVHPNQIHKDALEAVAKVCEIDGTKAAANAATYAAANAADAAANAAYAALTARDKFLSFVAEEVVQILIDMKSPGTAWLDLAPIQNAA
jgi:hypothetical protein